MIRTLIAMLSILCLGQIAEAQQYAGGPPEPARYQLRAGAGFPTGLSASASMRVLQAISLEAGVGVLPVGLTGTAGLNLHLSSTSELDPAISFLGTYMVKSGADAYLGTLAYSLLASRATSLHAYGRIGVSAMYLDKKFYPSPVLELGMSYGIH
jgi:hypothetical protein